MDTSSFHRLPESVQRLVTDGLDNEVQNGLERLDEAKKGGTTSDEQLASLEGDIRHAAELLGRYSA